jgi:hypothetical protein
VQLSTGGVDPFAQAHQASPGGQRLPAGRFRRVSVVVDLDQQVLGLPG